METIREEEETGYVDFRPKMINFSWNQEEKERRDREAALFSKFMEDVMPTKLFCGERSRFNDFCVFWSQDPSDFEHTSTSNWDIQDRIKTALCAISIPSRADVLVQFWAPEMIGGRRHLTTTLQPFALNKLTNEKLNEYRKHCVGFKLLVADVVEIYEHLLISDDGIVGRVFRKQLPKYCEDLREYSVREYPQLALALSCGIKSIFALPLFEPSGLGCVGVLEVLYLYPFKLDPLCWHVENVDKALKDAGLMIRTIDTTKIRSQISCVYKVHIREEIKAALKQVCETYKLAHAITWVSCAGISCESMSCNNSQECFHSALLVASRSMSVFSNNRTQRATLDITSTTLRVRQGLVGKAFSSLNPYFCRDVCQLNMSEYPLLHFARKLGFASCFAVCLRTISTGTHHFVIEFFLSRNETYGRDLVSLFCSILTTMKQQLKSFEVVIGDTENEKFTEVHKSRESFVQVSLGKGQNVINGEQSNTALSSSKTISTPTMSESKRTETEDSSESLRTTEGTLNSTCRKSVFPSSKRSKRVNESDQAIPESSFSVNESAKRADLDNGFKDDLDESETASTNWVKLFGYMMSANEPHIPILNQSRTESSHSDGPLSEASAAVAHNVPPCTPVSDVERMTIKVSYIEEDMLIKFDLPTLSSKEDLVKSVILGMHGKLNNKAFVIKYLDDVSLEPSLLIATDTDWQECIVRTRSRGKKLIRTVIKLEKDVQDMP